MIHSAKSDHIFDVLAPEEKKSTEGVAEMIVISEADDTTFEIVIDLIA